jgi:hypothetical protein
MRSTPRRLTVRALTALAFAAAVATPAPAQEQSTELPSWRLPGWTFTPGVIVGVLHDSNATLSSPDVDRTTPSDRMLRMQPFGQLEFFSPRTTFGAGYQGSVRRYSDLSALDGTDHQAYFSLRERVTRRVTLFANDNYSQVPTTDQLDLGGLPYQRTGARYNSAAGGVEARLTRATDLIVRYEMTWVDFVRKDTELTGGMVNGLHGELTHRFTERASAGAEYGTRWANLNEGTKDLSFQNAGAVFHYRTGEATTFDASAGIAHLFDRNTGVTHNGPYVKAGLRHLARRATVGASYSRSYVPSLAFGGANQSQEAVGYIRMPLSQNRLYLQESAAWRRTDPFITTVPALDSIFLQTVFGYAVQKWFRIEGYHTFTTQDNRLAAGKISRHLVGVQFVVSEPVRIR